VALAGRRHQLQRGVELGAGVVPPARQEPLHGQVGFVEGQVPVCAELLADPHARLERGPGVLEPVQLHQDASLYHVEWVLMPFPPRAVIGQPHASPMSWRARPRFPRSSSTMARVVMASVIAERRVRGLEVPTLVLHGAGDPLPAEGAVEIARLLPRARLELLPGMGHTPWLEDATTVRQAVRRFIENIATTAPS
jgi:pimeloyl-ACP methyl ester carboxylesterase